MIELGAVCLAGECRANDRSPIAPSASPWPMPPPPAALSSEVTINVRNASDDQRAECIRRPPKYLQYDSQWGRLEGTQTPPLLCVPVHGLDGPVGPCMQCENKLGGLVLYEHDTMFSSPWGW